MFPPSGWIVRDLTAVGLGRNKAHEDARGRARNLPVCYLVSSGRRTRPAASIDCRAAEQNVAHRGGSARKATPFCIVMAALQIEP